MCIIAGGSCLPTPYMPRPTEKEYISKHMQRRHSLVTIADHQVKRLGSVRGENIAPHGRHAAYGGAIGRVVEPIAAEVHPAIRTMREGIKR